MNIGRTLVLIFLLLAGCDELFQRQPLVRPEPRPEERVQSEESQRIEAYYGSVQALLVSQGKLRKDYAPLDAPFNANDLVRNFEKVALFDEYKISAQGFIEEQTSSYLRRWRKPIQIGIFFGEFVPEEQRQIDRRSVRRFAARLSAITGLKIQLGELKNANFVILFLNRDEQKTHTRILAQETPQLIPEIVTAIEQSPRNIFCAAYALTDESNPKNYTGSVILVKSEHPDLLRLACIQEEMTQSLGLANDGPDVRPSIFNDDEEFALLTRHDEFLLKMLYDPRLKDGMTPDVARPILREVAEAALKQSRI
ncbi:MAG: DUF2927 domain-containing protein [Rhodobacteraceae bacterium]|nr:DUF2927 domain-containing protein [Paracoccaceae bacterium]